MENQLPPGQTPPPLPPSQPPIFVSTAPPRRGGGGWMVLSLVLLGVIGIMIAGRLVKFATGVGSRSTGVESGRHFEEIIVENRDAGPKIAVVPIEGMIVRQFDPTGRNMVDVIEDQLKLAAKDSDVK